MVILKVTKDQGFTLSLENRFLEKPQTPPRPPPPHPPKPFIGNNDENFQLQKNASATDMEL